MDNLNVGESYMLNEVIGAGEFVFSDPSLHFSLNDYKCFVGNHINDERC